MASPQNTAASRALIGARFKVLCADAGLSIDQAADLLHVTPRTIRYWFSGTTWVPYTAYKLLRVMRYFELPGKEWAGWHFHSGRLWSPEGHGFTPKDSNWWGLLVRKARLFDQLYQRENALRQALTPPIQTAGRPDGPVRAAIAEGSPSGRGELVEPTGKAGGAAQPPHLDLSNKHFGTYKEKNGPVIGETAKRTQWQIAHAIPHREKDGVTA